jgi:hypothetical protein
LLSGHDLINYGVAQGPQVGKVLSLLREAQAAGEINTQHEAISFVHAWLQATALSTN